VADYVTFAQMTASFTARQVRETFTDDGAATMNETAFNEAVEAASGIADAILGKAWPDATSRAEIAADPAVNYQIRIIVMHLGAGRKPEWRGPGGNPYESDRKLAEKTLERIAVAGLRPAAESTAGANPNVGGATNVPESPQFVFAPSVGRPNTGGY
jgi:hypothetical protein